MIDNAIWHLSIINNINSKEAYNMEWLESDKKTISKIALMYPSDYAYASINCYTIKIYDDNNSDYRTDTCKNSNWLFNNNSNIYESTISPFILIIVMQL